MTLNIGAPGSNAETFADFLSFVEPGQTSGFLVLRNKGSEMPSSVDSKTVTIFYWNKGELLSEIGFQEAQTNLSINKVLFASGKWNGTNWEHQADQIVIHSKPGKDLSALMEDLGGRMPYEKQFFTLIGRGLDLTDFRTVTISNSHLKGMYLGKIPIEGVIMRGSNGNSLEYEYRLVGTQNKFKHSISINVFNANGWLTTRLKTYLIDKNNATNLICDYEVEKYGVLPDNFSFSPFDRYPNSKVMHLRDGVLYGNNSIPLPHSKESNIPVRGSAARIWILAFFLLSGIVLLILIFFSFRKT